MRYNTFLMHIFLAASIHGKSHSLAIYQDIVNQVTAAGHTIQADHLLKTSHDELQALPHADQMAFYQGVIDGIKQADAVFAEVSYPSTSVGYLMSVAMQANKPTVAFYNGDKEPHLFHYLEKNTDKLQVARYSNPAELKQEIKFGLEFITSSQDVRFNFFISPPLSSYLDWIARSQKVPRSVYLRQLIDEDMAHQAEYQREA